MKSKAQKRSEAKIRQEEYNKLTLEQKVERIKAQRGQSKRQMQRLKP